MGRISIIMEIKSVKLSMIDEENDYTHNEFYVMEKVFVNMILTYISKISVYSYHYQYR